MKKLIIFLFMVMTLGGCYAGGGYPYYGGYYAPEPQLPRNISIYDTNSGEFTYCSRIGNGYACW